MEISEFKRSIINICKTIECSEEMAKINKKFKNWSIEYAKKFSNLHTEIKKKELILDKKDLSNSYRREISRYIEFKNIYIILNFVITHTEIFQWILIETCEWRFS